MNLFSTLYIVLISVSFIIALIQFSYLIFTVVSLSAGTLSIFEIQMLNISDVLLYGLYVKYYHIPLFFFLVSVVWFIANYFGTAKKWMAVLFTSLWSICLIINFIGKESLTYKSIISISERLAFNGELYSVVHGVLNPLRLIADSASLLFLVYMLDASIRLYKKGFRERAIAVGGSSILFIIISGIIAPLSDLGILKVPPMVSIPFVFMVLAMSFELTRDIVSASKLTVQLSTEQNKWNNFLENVRFCAIEVDTRGIINYANPFFYELTGYAKSEVIGKEWVSTFTPKEDRETIRENHRKAASNQTSWYNQSNFFNKKGEVVEMLWSTVKISDENDEVTGFIGKRTAGQACQFYCIYFQDH